MVYSGRDSGLGAGRKVQSGVHHLLSKYLLRIFVYWTAFQGAVTDQMNGGAGSAESEDRGHNGGATVRLSWLEKAAPSRGNSKCSFCCRKH